ncbi:hypothetical protein LX99_03921 [Mucilaginibacter oryzae]|uniref:Uncharacterized protein n=1 Tax=Mucilaginibacter oryzae TaxID=468058 RepID=A0A316H4W9_9SPHI|nr:hypothetical protein LX99_03921 [Mucilaginibacter oryzae]
MKIKKINKTGLKGLWKREGEIPIRTRHCEVRSNRELYRAGLPVWDCFVLRNDGLGDKKLNPLA